MTAVEVRHLRRTYTRRKKEPRTALDDLNLVVETGEVHGLLGPNGAGKTTLCKILSTVLLPTSGTARVDGFDVVEQTDEVRRAVGIVFGGERGLYTRLTARQNLLYWSALYRQPTKVGRKRVEELLERLGLQERADEPVETFSRGMKQRLHLARGLVGTPRVLILDEPTVGMDPVAARDFRALVVELRGEGHSILLTTHDMAEAEELCDRVSLMDGGRLIATEDPKTIGSWLSRFERVRAEGVSPELAARLRDLPGVAAVESRGDQIVVEVEEAGATGEALRLLVEAGVTSLATTRPTLEEVYLQAIGDRGLGVR
ncbi:daunorubicin resistance protein DrrA family ABC transporter ATP-binding protein [Lentzea pudingi]|uniref:Daunorubicin resistance protein DrrA family ABC transporter ATP-binding protein n=1 Tax=Lentzea pudingi TaxID=1789439 RepID=A0ABQ2HSB1_9PSEU|nr:ABC transporter ATP-binding protein [Lentzea pudingi]GGM89369.1 daunorubicin resistance protein DrrA family ABC transporter ATP-binding protein [Lentzea pudingi]